MTASMGIGAVFGGLITAARGKTGLRPMMIASFAFGVVIIFAAVAPTLPIEFLALGWSASAACRSWRWPTRRSSSRPSRRCAAG